MVFLDTIHFKKGEAACKSGGLGVPSTRLLALLYAAAPYLTLAPPLLSIRPLLPPVRLCEAQEVRAAPQSRCTHTAPRPRTLGAPPAETL